MSTAFYPTNMRRQPAGGYNTKSTLQNIPYEPWKGTGLFANPVGVTSTHIRPLTNKDPGNVFPTGFGLPRPIKHYRKGTVIPIHFALQDALQHPATPEALEQQLIEYNVNRAVKSSVGSSLGGGNGGTGLISQMMDRPGAFIIKDNGNKQNTVNLGEGLAYYTATDNTGKTIDAECTNCNGVGIVSSWQPINNLNEQPEPNVTNPLLCCNQQRKAIQRVLPTKTYIDKNYYQTTYMYLYHRCQTFQQRQFNFVRGPIDKNILQLFLSYPFVTAKVLEYAKPGDPLAIANYYVAQCNPNFTVQAGIEVAFIGHLSKSLLDAGIISQEEYNLLLEGTPRSVQTFLQTLREILPTDDYSIIVDYLYKIAADPYNGSFISGPSNPRGCAQVIYKPSNPQFAHQGGVSSSTRTLKLNVDTISTAAARNRNKIKANAAINHTYVPSIIPDPHVFIYKDKVPPCQPQTFVGNPFFFSGQHRNKLICRSHGDGAQYHTYNTINNGHAGNYIGATQHGGSGYANKSSMSNSTYFNNLRHAPPKDITLNLVSLTF